MTSPASRPVCILDYGMGNLRSVFRAWEAVGAAPALVPNPEEVPPNALLVFPGQGAIGDTMIQLKKTGWDRFLKDWIGMDRPFFGICLGLQALFEHSEEADTPGLGLLPGRVRRFTFPGDPTIKVPHMGWNSVEFHGHGEYIEGLATPEAQFYFVHSYFVETGEDTLLWGRTTHGDQTFCSAIARGNLVATQFHPEKSQANGLQLYKNILRRLT